MGNERWRDIPGYEGAYQVSDRGRARSLPKRAFKGTRTLKPRPQRGYQRVHLSVDGQVKEFKIDVLVLMAFVGLRPPGMESCHEDGIPSHNWPENLRWDTHKGNHSDRIRHGTSNRGEKHGNSKLKSHNIIQIRYLRRICKWKQQRIAQAFGCARTRISMICSGRAWGHI